jgi:hypothetical protein
MKSIRRLTTSRLTSKKSKSQSETKRYEQLGRMLTNIYESGYIDRNQAYKMSFVKGLLTGLGGVIGATLLVALLIWILTVVSDAPLIERVTDPIISPVVDTIRNGQKK